jgi:hypothetical protein
VRGITFVHRNRDVDAVALDRCHGGRDLRRIKTARKVLSLQFLLGALEQ